MNDYYEWVLNFLGPLAGHGSCLDAAIIMQVSLRLSGLELLSLNIHFSSGEVWADHMPGLRGLSVTEQPEKVLTVASKCLMLLFCEPAIQPVLLACLLKGGISGKAGKTVVDKMVTTTGVPELNTAAFWKVNPPPPPILTDLPPSNTRPTGQ